jgi:hypothetical protein
MLHRGGLSKGAVFHQMRHFANEKSLQNGRGKVEEGSASCGEFRKVVRVSASGVRQAT